MTLTDFAHETTHPPAPLLKRLRIAGVRLADALLIAAILGLVMLVSLPRIEAYARASNERDAVLATALLGDRLGSEDGSAVQGGQDLPSLVAGDWHLSHRLRDARRIPDTSLLLYHGYHYSLDVRSGEILAWPRRAGGTGQTVYRWTRQAGLQRMANQAGQWTGTEVPPGTGEAWQSLSDDG